MLATRFIIALCPSTPVYYAVVTEQDLKDCPEAKYCAYATTSDKSQALAFETFDEAMDVASRIGGWGGAQRVEQVAVEVEDTRVTLDTPEARIEVRDNATAQYTAAIEAGYAERNAAEEVAVELRALGIKVGVDYRDGASCTVSLYLADHLGNLLDLNWDPMQDGFAYETEGDDACDIGETEAQHEAEPDGDEDTIPCDGCGATDAEPCGDSEGFAFCAACRAKDNDRSYEVDRQAMASKAVITPEEIAAAVRRTDCATVTLTDAQRERAAVLLTDALRDLIDFHLPRLIGNAQLDAAEGA